MTPAWRRFAADGPAMAALAIVGLFVGAAVFAGIAVPYDPLAIDLPSNYLPASRVHWLGTDHLGRDTFSRLLAGARVSLTIALVSTLAGLLFGAVLGLVAAWARGRTEGAIMQVVDVLLSFPDMLLAIAVATILGRGSLATIVAVAVFSIPIFARLVRASAQAVVGADFVLASRAAGASSARVLVRHVLPQCYAPIVAQGTITLGSAILFASGLSFLGLGVQPPDPEWGAMLARGRELLRSSPIGAVAPGVAITLVVLSFSLVGDGLKDALDRRRPG
ncbi:MAG: ABC transporter permease [Acidobacteria bacterium]|nr:ABC transporter permease [Acidobacteriota bacterium]